jgi:hypothetical protein
MKRKNAMRRSPGAAEMQQAPFFRRSAVGSAHDILRFRGNGLM